MTIPDQPAVDGDRTRRRALHTLLLSCALTLLSLALVKNIGPLWMKVQALDGASFMLIAMLFGTVLGLAPVGAVAALVVAVVRGVASIDQLRRTASPVLDRLLVGAGLLLWFAPSLALLGWASAAIARGSLRFARSADYVLATDPIPFLQGIGYLLIVAAALAYPGWVYWRKWFARRSGSDAPLTPTS